MRYEFDGVGKTWSRVSSIKGGSVNHYTTETQQMLMVE